MSAPGSRAHRAIVARNLRLMAFMAVVTLLYLAICWLILATEALAHDAPTGWTYPWSCCSSMDCREVADKAIEETRFGYRVAATGETIIYSDVRIKDSPDGHFHWCAHQAGIDANKTICLFVPPRGF